MKQREHKRSRLLACLLCLAMVLPLAPITAKAEGEDITISTDNWGCYNCSPYLWTENEWKGKTAVVSSVTDKNQFKVNVDDYLRGLQTQDSNATQYECELSCNYMGWNVPFPTGYNKLTMQVTYNNSKLPSGTKLKIEPVLTAKEVSEGETARNVINNDGQNVSVYLPTEPSNEANEVTENITFNFTPIQLTSGENEAQKKFKINIYSENGLYSGELYFGNIVFSKDEGTTPPAPPEKQKATIKIGSEKQIEFSKDNWAVGEGSNNPNYEINNKNGIVLSGTDISTWYPQYCLAWQGAELGTLGNGPIILDFAYNGTASANLKNFRIEFAYGNTKWGQDIEPQGAENASRHLELASYPIGANDSPAKTLTFRIMAMQKEEGEGKDPGYPSSANITISNIVLPAADGGEGPGPDTPEDPVKKGATVWETQSEEDWLIKEIFKLDASSSTDTVKVYTLPSSYWNGSFLSIKATLKAADGTETDVTSQRLTVVEGTENVSVSLNIENVEGKICLWAVYGYKAASGGGGGGGSKPTITQNPNGGKGTNTSVVAAGTLVSAVRAETKGGVLTMEVTPETVKELIAQVKDNPSNTDLITIQPKFHTSGSASALVIQSTDLDTLSNKTTAGLKSEGPVADITISHETVEQLAKRGNEVSINARRESQNTYSVSISSGGQKLNDLPMYVDIHTTCGFYTQAYLVKDSGETELIRWAIADQSGRSMRVFLPGAATVKFETNPPVNFMDMPQDSWGTGPVAFVASRGIFSGYDDGYFHPNTPMNRAMLVQILYGFEGKPDSGTAQFGDVKPTDWYAQAVGWAAEKGITKGCGNGQFGVSSIVSRQDAICFIYRWMGSPKANEGVLDRYSDAGSISPYARQAIAWALENDILTGDTASIISPTAQVTRYQAAKLITDLVQSQTAWNGSGKEG